MGGWKLMLSWWREELGWWFWRNPNLVSTYTYKEVPCAPRPMMNNKYSYKERIPKNMFMRIPIWKKLLSQEKRSQPLSTIKTTIISLTKVRIIYLLWHSRVVRNSNLTFGGYLAGTTPVLSVRSSLFVFVQVLFRVREDRVTYWWFFGISWRHLWECAL